MRDLPFEGPETFLVPNNMASLIRLGLICTHRCYLRQLLVNKEKYPRPKTSVEIDLGIDAYIPGTYITDERQKLKFINGFVN